MERRPKASFPSLPQSPSSSTLSIDGVFGFFDLPSGGSYLAVITDSEERYRGHGMEFRLITKVTLVRVSNAASAEEGGGTGKAAAAAAARMLGEEDGDDGEEEEDEDAKQLELLRMAFQVRAHVCVRLNPCCPRSLWRLETALCMYETNRPPPHPYTQRRTTFSSPLPAT